MAIETNGSAKPVEEKEDEKPVEKNDEKDEKVQYKPVGTVCDFRNLYQTKPDEDGQKSWTRELPSDLPAPAEDADSAQYALLIRKEKCYDGRKSLSVHSIVVQSEHLKGFLGKALDDYPGVTTTLDRLEFTAPFKPFVHRWEKIVSLSKEEQDPITKEHVSLFYNTMNEELQDVIKCKKDLVEHGVITYPLAWTIMEPHDLLVSSVGGITRGHQFDSMTLTKCGWRLQANHIEFDGNRFGYDGVTFAILPFTGTVPITSLPVFPLKYHPEEESIREMLTARGKRWEEHKGYHFKSYSGIAFNRDYNVDNEDEDRDTKCHVKGRIIIDADAYNTFHPNGVVSVETNIDEDTLNDSQRLIASPMVYGYSLKDKLWLIFYLDSSHEIKWDERAFDSLVLPKEEEGLKEVILGVAKSHSKKLDTFDDIVQGKGRGIVMQLAGPPGVGKTLTAESVAEVMKVPLYVMSAGDLGMEANDVERNLEKILKAVPRWGAVLLLDEADVFMEARDATDLTRNGLVSIFLRVLEYYEGILFLTTNRAQNIDPAFESRIHISLQYKELDVDSRRHIWKQFLSRSTETVTDAQINEMAEVPLNGRQIKNAIKTAGLLAWSKETSLGYEHLKTVLSLRN